MSKKALGDATETFAHRAALEAYLEAFEKNLTGLDLAVLQGTTHEHVSILKTARDGAGLKCTVRISFDKTVIPPEQVKEVETLRGLDLNKLLRIPPRA